MMVAGKLEARGRGVNDIMLTLQEERLPEIGIEAETEAPLPPENVPPVRLLGGRTSREGRLQVKCVYCYIGCNTICFMCFCELS